MEKLLPILSDSLNSILEKLVTEHDNQIASDVVKAHKLTTLYNTHCMHSSDIITQGLIQLRTYIDQLITEEVRALSIRPNIFELSFTPKGKSLLYTSADTWSRDGRQTGKPAKIIKKLLRNTYKNRDLEIFNNLLKAEILNIGDFVIVTGNEIIKYYNEETYYSYSGSLGNSCMRHSDCETFFDLYKDLAQMLICIKDKKIRGRAIIWKLKDKTLMDRVYVCDDYVEQQFIDYAKQQNWWIRELNGLLNDGDIATWLSPNDNYCKPVALCETIQCNQNYDLFPYIDSFRYYDYVANSISTNPKHGLARLSSTNGGIIYGQLITCAHCNHSEIRWENEDDDFTYYYSDYKKKFYCECCCEWNEDIHDTVPIDADMVDVAWIDCTIHSIPYEFVLQNQININQYCKEDKFIYTNNRWYNKQLFKWDIKLNKYILDED